VLGVILFGERLDLNPLALFGESAALVVLVASVILLSRSPLVQDEEAHSPPSTAPVQPLRDQLSSLAGSVPRTREKRVQSPSG
jgi:hypothetical protein